MRKNQILYFTSLLFTGLLIAITSCTKVIDIELKDAERKYVVEGAVYEGVDSVLVRLTKTNSFFSTNTPQGLNNGVVKLTMPDQSIITLNSIGEGYYKASGLTITPASTYAMRVEIDGQTFTASSYMKPSMPLDSLEYEFSPGIFGGEDGFSVFLYFQDQPGKDWYRILSSVDGIPLNKPEDILVIDDNLNDGNLIRIPIFTHTYDYGDTVDVELQSLDAPLYEFYQTFAAVASEDAGSPFNAAPANPESNIQGGALGVFGAYTSSRRTIILPQ